MTKIQNSKHTGFEFENWNFEFIWNLEFVIWKFV
jgi:hypothetical protein